MQLKKAVSMPQSDDPRNEKPGTSPAKRGTARAHRGVRRNEPWPPPEFAALGRILRPHGIRGELRVYPYTRTADELVAQCPDEVVAWTPKGGAKPMRVESLSAHQNIVLIAFEEVETRNDAELLRDAFLCIREEDRWQLQEDEYYMDDLVGLEVRDADSGDAVGQVIRVADGAAHDHLEIAVPGRAKPALVPFVRAFVVRVDVAGGRIEVRLPEGLLDLDSQPAK